MIARTSLYSAVLVFLALLAVVLLETRGDTPRVSASTQTITICKVTSPPGGTGFPFNWTAGSSGSQPGFSLDDGQCTSPPLDVTLLDKFNTITEVVPSGWILTNITCNNVTSPVSYTGSNANPAFQPGDDTVQIDLNEANVTCTFTNTCAQANCSTPTPTPTSTCPPGVFCTPTPTPTHTPVITPTPTATPAPGSITICKHTDPPGGTGFTFGWSSPTIHPVPFTLGDGGCSTFTGLTPDNGPYTFTETPLPAGWTVANIVCTGGASILIGSNSGFDPGDASVVINLGSGENVTCTFTNVALCASPGGLDISTGTAGIGSVDPIWTVVSAPSGAPTPDAYGVPGDYGPWVAPSSSATNWIDPNNTGGPPPGTFPPTDPGGSVPYIYETTFAVPSGSLSFTLTFEFAADNNIQLFLNSTLIPGTAVNNAWSTLHGPITVLQANPSGSYTLRARVVNSSGPHGLLLEGSVICELVNTPPPTPRPTATPRPVDWGDGDCDGEITTRDNQGLLRRVLDQTPLSQTPPCFALGDDITLAGIGGWGDWDCDGEISTRDNQALLREVLDQTPLTQDEPCPDIGASVDIVVAG